MASCGCAPQVGEYANQGYPRAALQRGLRFVVKEQASSNLPLLFEKSYERFLATPQAIASREGAEA